MENCLHRLVVADTLRVVATDDDGNPLEAMIADKTWGDGFVKGVEGEVYNFKTNEDYKIKLKTISLNRAVGSRSHTGCS